MPPRSRTIDPLVLIIDDHDDGRIVLGELLGMNGFRTVCAASGEEALVAFTVERPDVVIVDLGLPDVSGADLAATLRSRSDVPIICYTGFVDIARHSRALQAGCDAVLVKPAEADVLVRAVRNALTTRKQRPGRTRRVRREA